MKKVVFVCTGNTCRSPMAEGLFREYLKNKGVSDIEVSSAGIYCFEGSPASENAVKAALELGADISSHRSCGLASCDFTDETYFICMTESHMQVLRQAKSGIKAFALNVSDPYGGDIDKYRITAKQICKHFDEVFYFINAEYTISEMRKGDITEISQIEKEYFSLPWSEKSLSEELGNPVARFYAARISEKTVGYIGAFNVGGEVSITNIAVKQEYRNRGIGSSLINFLKSKMQEEKAEFITLEVRESNETAITLYEKSGFKTVGKRKGFYENPKEDAVLMTFYF